MTLPSDRCLRARRNQGQASAQGQNQILRAQTFDLGQNSIQVETVCKTGCTAVGATSVAGISPPLRALRAAHRCQAPINPVTARAGSHGSSSRDRRKIIHPDAASKQMVVTLPRLLPQPGPQLRIFTQLLQHRRQPLAGLIPHQARQLTHPAHA